MNEAGDRAPVHGRVNDVSPGFVRRYAWAVYLIAMTVLALLYLFAKNTPLHSGPIFNVIGVSSVAAVVAGILIHRVARLAWALTACGLATFVAERARRNDGERNLGDQHKKRRRRRRP